MPLEVVHINQKDPYKVVEKFLELLGNQGFRTQASVNLNGDIKFRVYSTHERLIAVSNHSFTKILLYQEYEALFSYMAQERETFLSEEMKMHGTTTKLIIAPDSMTLE